MSKIWRMIRDALQRISFWWNKGEDAQAELNRARKEAEENYQRWVNANATIRQLKNEAANMQAELNRALREAQKAQKDYKRLATTQKSPSRDILKMFQSLLPVIDEFDLAFAYMPEDISENTWVEGVLMIRSRFEKLLKKYQIEAIDPAAGDHFDPNFHQTIGAQDSDEIESGHVTTTRRKGYRAGEIVLRAALVLIAR